MSTNTTQRLDKWLWFARLTKTRTQASRLIESGKVRINRIKVVKPASTIRAGNVITAMVNRRPKIVKILELGKRRGPASEAQELYEDLTPPFVEEQTVKKHTQKLLIADTPKRERGTGRPTKRERRKMEQYRNRAGRRSETGIDHLT